MMVSENETEEKSMLQVKGLQEGLEIFKTLGSDVRMRIIELLSEHGEMNMNELASALELTNGALTAHIKRLEDCGIIKTVSEYTGHGNQKKCSMKINQLLLSVSQAEEAKDIRVFETEVRVGHYTDYSVKPSCGLANAYSMIGGANDPRFFSHPEHYQAGLLWFQEGYVEYEIQNPVPESHVISQLTFCFELSSGLQGIDPQSQANVVFYLNGVRLGSWMTTWDMGGVKGIYTPSWWNMQEHQHGFLKMIVVNHRGTFLDGLKISDVNLYQLQFDPKANLKLRVGVEKDDTYKGGVTLYGAGFGNYNQDIKVRIHYLQAEKLNDPFFRNSP